MEKILRKINNIVFIFFIGFTLFTLITSYNVFEFSKLLLVLCIIPLSMLPYIIGKFKLVKINELLIFIYYVFLFISLILGCIFGFYRKIWWFDLFAHFISGILSAVISQVLLKEFKISKKIFNVIFIVAFVIAIAAIWEYFEFTLDLITGNDTQYVLETGVSDTMEDMLIATLGGILVSINYIYNYRVKY